MSGTRRFNFNVHRTIPIRRSIRRSIYLRQAAGLASQDSAEEQLNKLERHGDAKAESRTRTRCHCWRICSRSKEHHRDPPLTVSSEKRKDMTLEALVQYLQRLADRCPMLFIVEDAHWLDPTTLDLMTRIIGRIRQMRVLLLITFRPNFKPVWADYSHVTSPDAQSASTSAERRARGGDDRRESRFRPRCSRRFWRRPMAYPSIIEAMTENVLESGLLTEGNDAFTLKGPLQNLPIPDSLHALLMERVDRLGPAKNIVQTGAAIGREFTYELLQATVEMTDSQLKNALDLFVASGLMFQEGEIPLATYHFKHALVQDAAYSTLPKKPRRVLHARIAKALESRFAERVTDGTGTPGIPL